MQNYIRKKILAGIPKNVGIEGNSRAKTIVLAYPKAPLGKRCLAQLIDLVIAWGPMMAAYFLMGLESAQGLKPFLWVPALLWGLIYYFVKDGWPGGQSIGKKLSGLMVISLENHRPCTRAKSAMRQFAMVVMIFIPYVGLLVEPVIMLADAGGRRVGDQFARTQVIEITAYQAA